MFVAYNASEKAQKGVVENKTFYSEALNQEIGYAIYLPPGYDELRYRFARYPVVYLLPGSSGGTKTLVSAGISEQMDELLAEGQVQPMILVVPQERPGSQSVKGTGYVDGPLGNWATYTTKDLINEIDSNYRTINAKEGRAIVGTSEGGYGAMNLGLKNASEFGVIGSFSGYFTIDADDLERFFGGNQSLAEANSPKLHLPQLQEQLPAIYLLIGQDDKHYLEENQKFAEVLKAAGATYEFHTVPAEHQTKEYLPDFLIFASKHLTIGE